MLGTSNGTDVVVSAGCEDPPPLETSALPASAQLLRLSPATAASPTIAAALRLRMLGSCRLVVTVRQRSSESGSRQARGADNSEGGEWFPPELLDFGELSPSSSISGSGVEGAGRVLSRGRRSTRERPHSPCIGDVVRGTLIVGVAVPVGMLIGRAIRKYILHR